MKTPTEGSIQAILEKCVDCGLCTKECTFLNDHGSPLFQAMDFGQGLHDGHLTRPFLCNLCGLCNSVCPNGLDPLSMFLDMRRSFVKDGGKAFRQHRAIINYERTGTSRHMTWYGLPKNCRAVFFPGCILPGTRPANTLKLYRHLKKIRPDIGIVLDCCTKPSHDLGRTGHFASMFNEMKDYLVSCGVTEVLVACPSCYKIFETYGPPLETRMVYEEIIREGPLLGAGQIPLRVTVHDPCILRNHDASHGAVRDMIRYHGLTVREMEHSKSSTVCCGEGGAVPLVSPDLSKRWGQIRKKEVENDHVISYCAGCTNVLGRIVPCDHVIDLYFNPEKTLQGKAVVSKAPFTYLNRIMLKKKLKKEIDTQHERERPMMKGNKISKNSLIKRLAIVALILAAFFAARHFGLNSIIQGDSLTPWITSYGMYAPLIFVLLYTLAPALLLPGLPMTIAAGVLFGPFWGVVYSILGATLGASLSFLISRYLARDLIMSKLNHPRWKKLDDGVAKNGWKMVALTRLIPLFPYNLLNYAFGLTRIGFIPYALTSFVCMLPACIAFIVFSSSLIDLIKGSITPAFIVGLCLIGVVSLIPVIYHHIKKNRRDS